LLKQRLLVDDGSIKSPQSSEENVNPRLDHATCQVGQLGAKVLIYSALLYSVKHTMQLLSVSSVPAERMSPSDVRSARKRERDTPQEQSHEFCLVALSLLQVSLRERRLS